MRILFFTIIIFFLLTSCSREQKVSDATDLKNDEIVLNCKCLEGIGSSIDDTPILQFKFLNGKTISVCGFVDKQSEERTLSEFNVFDCSTGMAIVEYDATQICRIVEKKDTLVIEEFRLLPILKNYEWNLVKISEQIITTDANKIIVTRSKKNVAGFSIDEKSADKFLDSISIKKGLDMDWEVEIGYLEALSILGNIKAWEFLQYYDSLKGIQVDGHLSESLSDAISTVEWLRR